MKVKCAYIYISQGRTWRRCHTCVTEEALVWVGGVVRSFPMSGEVEEAR